MPVSMVLMRAGAAATLLAVALSGCAGSQTSQLAMMRYDFGVDGADPVPNVPAPGVPIKLAGCMASADLDTDRFHYRLAYGNPQEARTYATSRWTMPPPQLLTAQVRARLAERGRVLGIDDGADAPVLKLELVEFMQIFDQPGVSRGVVRMRASLMRNGTLIAQRNFSADAPAISADAAGGARALAQAGNAAVAQIVAWTASQLI
jgi:cholesterol transport system auxiliary component